MANHGNMTALDERGPGFFGFIGGQTRRDDQRNGKKADRYATDVAKDTRLNHDMPSSGSHHSPSANVSAERPRSAAGAARRLRRVVRLSVLDTWHHDFDVNGVSLANPLESVIALCAYDGAASNRDAILTLKHVAACDHLADSRPVQARLHLDEF
jgi:hypothetical protein